MPPRRTPYNATDSSRETTTATAEPGPDTHRLTLTLNLPDELLHQLSEQIAELLAKRDTGAAPSPWLTLPAAAAYLGCSRDRLYKLTAARAIPFRRREGGQRLLFHCEELDAWVETTYQHAGCAL
jgi:excisionase family DNA binding protein